jgi:hypothetical protein
LNDHTSLISRIPFFSFQLCFWLRMSHQWNRTLIIHLLQFPWSCQ